MNVCVELNTARLAPEDDATWLKRGARAVLRTLAHEDGDSWTFEIYEARAGEARGRGIWSVQIELKAPGEEEYATLLQYRIQAALDRAGLYP
jgi:hypothetical protein